MPDQRDPVTGEGIMQGSPGLTKRDYFAAAALIGLGTWTPNTDISLGDDPSRHDMDSVVVRRARWALAQADALIAASKTGGPEHG